MELHNSVQYLKGVGERRAALLKKLDVQTIEDLVHLYPRTYEDWSHPVCIAEAPVGEVCCIRAAVGGPVKKHVVRRGMTLYKTVLTDGIDVLQLTIFNNGFLAEKLEEGDEYLFYGKVGGDLLHKELTSPEVQPAADWQPIRAVYPQTQGLTSRAIGRLVETALAGVLDKLPETLPAQLRERYCLVDIARAVHDIHLPPSMDHVTEARRRLIFGELLVLQLGLLRLKGRNRQQSGTRMPADKTTQFLSRLPFAPTGAQQRCIKEAVQDMQSGAVMNRLLQGDVGSGKTAVAAALCYSMIAGGSQCAFMAPTEVLARQHMQTLEELLQKEGIQSALLVGSTTAANKRKCKAQIAAGEIQMVIGTHALLQQDVVFQKLGLVVTDEQHRFGVNQRAALNEKGEHPHLLVMSATPIPRTLALIIYGDLDVSVLDEMPPGRQKIETYAVDSAKRERAFGYVKKHLDRGLQGYIVCPLVQEGESELVAATQYQQEIAKTAFAGYNVGLIHGRMKAKDKQETMRAFYAGEIQLLVSTTVIEVGVDVPNAVIMVIENAERFGLSQLHQLRGRVGRGKEKSTCILISDAKTQTARRRLQVMCETMDGFRIAEEDLALRGPGDFFGARQHGLPQLRIADMATDTQSIAEAQQVARAMIEQDPLLQQPQHIPLQKAVDALFQTVGETGLN